MIEVRKLRFAVYVALGVANTVWYFWAYQHAPADIAPWVFAILGPLATLTLLTGVEIGRTPRQTRAALMDVAEMPVHYAVGNLVMFLGGVACAFAFGVALWDYIKSGIAGALASAPLQFIQMRKFARA